MRSGRLIVIDGADGSGKATQTKLLAAYLLKAGHRVKTIDFPRYNDNLMGGFIGKCLQGKYGDFLGLDPHITSVLYAADRLESKSTIEKWLKEGYTVLADRYVSANQIHQGGKIRESRKRAEFMQWLEKLEFEVLGLPRPAVVIYLAVPMAVSSRLLRQEGKLLDLSETDRDYQKNSRKSALWLSRIDRHWIRIECSKRGRMKTREEIHQEIVTALEKTNIL